MKRSACLPLTAAMLLLAACSSEKTEPKKEAEAKPEAPKEQPVATKIPDEFKVKMETSKGNILIAIHKTWAPIGAERFHQLVEDNFFTGARFFRLVPNFIIQFGLAADPAMTRKWDRPIKDDPVIRTNKAGTITFATAGPGTRTSQLFFNTKSNQILDDQGFAPFGEVTEGMDVVLHLFAGYGERPDQGLITNQGNAYLLAQFPNLDYIKKATIVP